MGKLKRFRLPNLLGGMNVEAEDNSLLALDPNASLGAGFTTVKTEFRDQRNFAPLNRGGLSLTHGYESFRTIGPTAPVKGIFRYTKSNGTSYLLAACNGQVYDITSSSTAISGLTVSSANYPDFETALDTLIVCDGAASAPKTWDGTTVSTLVGTPPAGAQQAIFYKNRLWVWSKTSNQSLVYYSDAGTISTGYASNFVQCDINDGQVITGVRPFFIAGEFEPVLVIGKGSAAGVMTGDGTASSPFAYARISQDLGVPNFRAMVAYENDIAFLTPRGIASFVNSSKNENIKRVFLTQNLDRLFTPYSATSLLDAHSWHDWRNKRIGFALRHDSGAYPNRIYYWDYQSALWYYQDGFNITCAFTDTDGTVYFGDDTGKVYKYNPNLYTYNGSSTSATLQTGYMDFFSSEGLKRINYASISARPKGAGTVSISCSLDFGDKIGSTHTLNFSNAAYTWDGGVWASDAGNEYRWGDDVIQNIKFFPKGVFKNIQFTINATGCTAGLDLFEFNFEVEYLNKV